MMRARLTSFAVLCVALLASLAASLGTAFAQGAPLSAIARVEAARTSLSANGEAVELRLGLSQAVPWRLRYLAEPPRAVLDFREVDFSGLNAAAMQAGGGASVTGLRAGPMREGWSRLEISLSGPHLARLAGLRTAIDGAGQAELHLVLQPAEAAAFAAEAARPDAPEWTLPKPAELGAARPPRGSVPLVVVLDPGHGGVDPGAERGGHNEADLMLTFARELKEALVRAGVAEVVMTREEDKFVPLETRIAVAHQARGDLFISLHADAVAEGIATGATAYVLSDEASDAADAALAERHDRDALISGVDLKGQDDLIAGVLMDMARVETAPRSQKLAQQLIASIRAAKLPLHKVPHRKAAFSVLKAPDIPSVLLEVGYMSSPRDLQRLLDPEWRARMIGALVEAISAWAIEDAATSGLMRQ